MAAKKSRHGKKRSRYKASKASGPDDTALFDAGALKSQIENLAKPLCLNEGLELVHLELLSQPSGKILRLYIDRVGGITLDDCAAVSRQLGDMLDVSIEGDWAYKLEVSSPGANRPVSKIKDFKRFAGQDINIKMVKPIDGKNSFAGKLAGAGETAVTIMVADKSLSIPFEDIKSARLINYNGEL
jgi:ribosome maturation factor RimP